MDFIKLNKTQKEKDQRFMQIPKNLYLNPKYRDNITATDYLIYGLLLDRARLSRKTTNDPNEPNWVNSQGDLFVRYNRKKIKEAIGVSPKTATNSFKRLEAAELLKVVRGMKNNKNKPNEFYVVLPDDPPKEEKEEEKVSSVKSSGGTCKKYTTPPKKGNTIDTELSDTEKSDTNYTIFKNEEQSKQANKVWNYYSDKVESTNKDYELRVGFNDKRKRKLKSVLDNFTVDELKQTVDAAFNDNYFNGRKDGTFRLAFGTMFSEGMLEKFWNDAKNNSSVDDDIIPDYYADLD